jgi:gliding motility-associated protein GldM
MSSQKLTPRQKMINMMYLVLIALLALNVSREILKSFYLFELSFHDANAEMEAKNLETMNSFNAKMSDEKTKARAEEWVILAQEARKISADFNSYVEQIKTDVIKNGGGRDVENQLPNTSLSELKKPDDMEEHVHYFSKDGLDNGQELQKRINRTREQLIELVSSVRNGDRVKASLLKSTQFKANNPVNNTKVKKTWVNNYLEEAPLAGVVTLLTKTQNDCKTLESQVLSILHENINIESIVNDGQMALIMPNNYSVMSGDVFRAKVALATYDTRTQAQMLINGKPISVVNGIGEIEIPAHGTESHQLVAQIESIDPKTGKPVMIDSDPLTWSSFQASASISADNMNVLFIGLKNPLSISIPGVTPANTIVSSTSGIKLSKTGEGKYIATANKMSNTEKVIVQAKMSDGSIKKMGEMVYRVRRVPDPNLRIGNLKPGTYSLSNLKAQLYLYAVLEDFYFKDVSFKVVSYSAHLFSKRPKNYSDYEENSNSLSKLRTLLNSAQSGDAIIFDNIKVSGPSGISRRESITYTIK